MVATKTHPMTTGTPTPDRQSFEDLIAWQKAHALFLEVHRVTRAWPTEERYDLTSQARRAAFSVAANLVEGNAKRGAGELRRFLDISVGSLAEVRYAIRAAVDLGYCSATALAAFHALASETGKLLWGLLKSAERRKGTR
jgi:four helix bundle protein